MTDADRIAAAERAVDRARERLVDTVQSVAEQLEPRRLVRELWEDAKVKGADLAEEAVEAVKARPLAATGVTAAVAMFLAREPIADLVGKLWSSDKKKPAGKRPAKPRTAPKSKLRQPKKATLAKAALAKPTEKTA
ncbi:MAG: hypothetical protein ABIS39_00060 [Sphingomicrobium sp.]